MMARAARRAADGVAVAPRWPGTRAARRRSRGPSRPDRRDTYPTWRDGAWREPSGRDRRARRGPAGGTEGQPRPGPRPPGRPPGREDDGDERAPDGRRWRAARGTGGRYAAAGAAAAAGRRSRRGRAGAAPDGRASAGQSTCPRWLRVSAGWAWRLLLLAALLYVAGKVASLLYVVIVPFAAAILLTALLQPLTARLRRAGLGPLSATWCTLLLAFALIGGAVWLVTTRVEAEYPALVTQVGRTSTQIQNWLASSPLHIRTGNLEKISDNLVNYLTQHRSTVEGAALTGGRIVVELLAGPCCASSSRSS